MLYRRALEHLVLPLGDVALGTSFRANLKAWREIQWLPAQALERLQTDNLGRLLGHASAKVPLYRDRKVRRDEDVRSWLRQFPVVTKEDVKGRLDDLVAVREERVLQDASSGSSELQGVVDTSKL